MSHKTRLSGLSNLVFTSLACVLHDNTYRRNVQIVRCVILCVSVCVGERDTHTRSVIRVPLIDKEPVLDASMFLRSLGKEHLVVAFTWVNVYQLLPQISFACHFLYSQGPVMARKGTLLPGLCYLEGPSGSRDAGHFCLFTFHFLFLSLWLIRLV